MNMESKGRLLMLCGALQDLSEIAGNGRLGEQIKNIQTEIESIVVKEIIPEEIDLTDNN